MSPSLLQSYTTGIAFTSPESDMRKGDLRQSQAPMIAWQVIWQVGICSFSTAFFLSVTVLIPVLLHFSGHNIMAIVLVVAVWALFLFIRFS